MCCLKYKIFDVKLSNILKLLYRKFTHNLFKYNNIYKLNKYMKEYYESVSDSHPPNKLQNTVTHLRNKNEYKDLCRNEKNLLNKCILCKYYMTSQEWATEMEKFIKNQLNIENKINEISGDGHKNNKNIEIKVSFGSKDGQFNIVQIRPDHNIDYYLFVGYNLFVEDLGKTYVLYIPSEELYKLLPKYGGYSHGTKRKFSEITSENIKGRNCEYSLRANPNKRKSTKTRELWDELLKYEIDFQPDMIC